jgi:hypothetical protein
MSYILTKGSQVYLESARAANKAIESATNANPVVFTSTAHGYTNGDPVLLLMESWSDFNNVVAQVSAVTTDTFTMAGYSSTDTTMNPTDGDTGTSYEITFGTKIGQILEASSEGGEPKFETISPWDVFRDIDIPNGETASRWRCSLGFDQARTDQQALLAASRARTPKAMKFVMGGAVQYGYGYVWASEQADYQPVVQRKIAFLFIGRATSFVAA